MLVDGVLLYTKGICLIMNCPSCLLLTQKRVAAKPSGEEGNSEDSERLQAAREKRQASRNRLREMKAAAKRAREANEAVVTELPSPKKTKGTCVRIWHETKSLQPKADLPGSL